MKKLLLLLGAAAFAVGTPAVAQGNSQSKQNKAQSAKVQSKGHGKQAKVQGRHIVTTRAGDRLYAFNARGSCPPGLAKKNNGCMPPGQAKKAYNVGQRYNSNFGYAWTYNQIPMDLRSRYDFDRNARYYYRDGYLYQVDPRTMVVRQVISALLR